MCTVSFIPLFDKIYITSNRDEKIVRKKALPPAEYYRNGTRLIFPKDGEAEGSWIAVNENRNVAVLLNGAFIPHVPKPPYAISRGLILIDIIKDNMPLYYFLGKNLENIEPFTLILYSDNDLFECRWDGSKKHIVELTRQRPYIWSSVT